MEVVQKAASAWAKEANARLEETRSAEPQEGDRDRPNEIPAPGNVALEPAVPRTPSYIDGRPPNMYQSLKDEQAQILESSASKAEAVSADHPAGDERTQPERSEAEPRDPTHIGDQVPARDNEDTGDRLSWSEDREPEREREHDGGVEPQRNPDGLNWSEHRSRDAGLTR